MNYFKYIYDIVSPVVNGKAFPADAYQQTELPYVIIDVDVIDPIDGKVSPTKADEVEFSIVIIDEDLDAAQATGLAIRQALDKNCTYPIKSCNLVTSTFSFDQIHRAYTYFQSYYSRMTIVTGPIRNYNPLHYSSLHYST